MAGSPEASTSSDHVEVEWQLDALDLRPVERWLGTYLPAAGSSDDSPWGMVQGEGRTRVLTDVYLDTEDWRVFRAGFALRTRKQGKAAETTLKSFAHGDGGPTRRVEITESIDLKSEPLEDGPIAHRVRAVAGTHAVLERIRIATRRTTIPLVRDGTTVADLCLDRSLIPIGPGEEPVRFRRVEIEIQRPDVADQVEVLADALRTSCGLRPSAGSKFEVALLALGIDPTLAAETGPTAADTDSSVGELAFAVMRRQFAAMQAHEPGTRLGEDPEELHDMRVAVRRLRAALRLFREALPVRADRLRSELRWAAQLLGAVRDLDVQLADLDELDPKLREDVAPVSALLVERREAARRAMLDGLDSRRYERLVRSFGGFLRHGPLQRSPRSRAPAVAVAPDLVADRYAKVRRRGDRLKKSSPAEKFHRARIQSKKLRYSLEMLEDLYGSDARDMIRSLVKIQDLLGDHQDAVVAATHLRDVVDQEGTALPPSALFAMGRLAERHERRARRLKRRFPKAYRKVDAKSWRHLERAMGKLRPSAWTPVTRPTVPAGTTSPAASATATNEEGPPSTST